MQDLKMQQEIIFLTLLNMNQNALEKIWNSKYMYFMKKMYNIFTIQKKNQIISAYI